MIAIDREVSRDNFMTFASGRRRMTVTNKSESCQVEASAVCVRSQLVRRSDAIVVNWLLASAKLREDARVAWRHSDRRWRPDPGARQYSAVGAVGPNGVAGVGDRA